MDALKIISEGSIKAEKPQFNVGDTVRVDVRIKDGDRERIQAFEGTVIAKKHGGVAETFHRSPRGLRCRHRACLPRQQPLLLRRSLLSARGQGSPRKAVLSAWPYGQGCQGQERYLIIPRFETGRKGTTCCPFFSFFKARVYHKIKKGWWQSYGKQQQSPSAVRGQGMLEWYEALISAALVLVLIFSFFFRIIQVDGRSMVPTLTHGDKLIVWAAGYTHSGAMWSSWTATPSTVSRWSSGSSPRAATPSASTMTPVRSR